MASAAQGARTAAICFSCFVWSFLLFCLFEIFPALVPLACLDNVLGYYVYKANYIPDPKFGFREKPFNRRLIHDFKGTQLSASLQSLSVPPQRGKWSTTQLTLIGTLKEEKSPPDSSPMS